MYKRPSLISQPYHPVTDCGEFPMATSRICGGGGAGKRKFAQTDLKVEKPALVTYEHTFL